MSYLNPLFQSTSFLENYIQKISKIGVKSTFASLILKCRSVIELGPYITLHVLNTIYYLRFAILREKFRLLTNVLALVCNFTLN